MASIRTSNANVQLCICHEGCPSMVPAFGSAQRRSGTKICLEGNEDAQICMVPRDSVEESPLTSGKGTKICLEGNKDAQICMVPRDSVEESPLTSGEADLQITNIQSQIMCIPSAGASAPLVAQSATTNLPQTATNQQEAPGSVSNVRWPYMSNCSLGLQFDRFRKEVKGNEALTSMAEYEEDKRNSDLRRKLAQARPQLVRQMDATSIECIIDELIAARAGLGLITDEERQLIKAEQTSQGKARRLLDAVAMRGADAIRILATTLNSSDCARPDLAKLFN